MLQIYWKKNQTGATEPPLPVDDKTWALHTHKLASVVWSFPYGASAVFSLAIVFFIPGSFLKFLWNQTIGEKNIECYYGNNNKK